MNDDHVDSLLMAVVLVMVAGLVILVVALIWYHVAIRPTEHCSAFANSPLYDVPARCHNYFTGGA